MRLGGKRGNQQLAPTDHSIHKKTGQHPQGLLAGSTLLFDGTAP
jgi:hypothetical protein